MKKQKVKVLIYLTENCPYCVRAKRLLTDKGVQFEVTDLTHNPKELEALKLRTGWRTVPQIFFGDELIGGYTDIAELDHSGELEQRLFE